MTPGETLALLASAHLGAAMSPGANTLLVVQTAARSRALGFATAAGFWPAGALWAAAGLAGIGGLLATAPYLESGLRLACGAYLLYLGARAFARSFAVAAAPDGPRSAPRWRAALAAGFLTNVSNPKSIAYYMSVFTATGAFALSPGYRFVAVLLLPSVGFLWYGALVVVASSGRARGALGRVSRLLERVAGLAMMGFGARLVSSP